MAYIKAKHEFFGMSGFLQLAGLALLFLFPVGTIIGLGLIIYGSAISKKYICSECGYVQQSKHIKICGNCKAELRYRV